MKQQTDALAAVMLGHPNTNVTPQQEQAVIKQRETELQRMVAAKATESALMQATAAAAEPATTGKEGMLRTIDADSSTGKPFSGGRNLAPEVALAAQLYAHCVLAIDEG